MQPQDITETVKVLKDQNKDARIVFIIDGIKVNTPDYELRLVNGATLIRIVSDSGQCAGVFDSRSVAGILDVTIK